MKRKKVTASMKFNRIKFVLVCICIMAAGSGLTVNLYDNVVQVFHHTDMDVIDISKDMTGGIPRLYQTDSRWKKKSYGTNVMEVNGCGPTCLSMVSIYLLDDCRYTPLYVAEFAERNGYSVDGNGSSWSLISGGGKVLGLDVTEIPLDEKRIIRNLKAGNPIICIMGPGDFTSTGHFIVMTEYIDGKIKVNDPNSKLRSEKLWDLSDIKNQIRNLWVCRK